MLSSDLNPPLRLLAAFSTAYPEAQPEHFVHVSSRSMWAAINPDDSRGFTLYVPDLDARTTFSLRTAKFKKTVLNRPLPKWARYPAGVMLELAKRGLEVDPFGLVIVGDETRGIRYEYALGIITSAAIHTLQEKPYDDDALNDIVEKVRRDYIGG